MLANNEESANAKSVEHEFYSPLLKDYRKGKTKYVIVTGSVMSGVGKGTFSGCLATLLTCHGLKVSPIKFDGYLNYDAGTLNPYRHGEVFVLEDGTECDLDLGSYERFLNRNLTKDNYLTGGKIFKTIIDKERSGQYLGRDVQFIPHVVGEIRSFLRELAMKTDADVVLVEVGGTIGDLENSYFIEAMRELRYEEGRDNVCFVNVTYIVEPGSLGEHKSKPAQLGIRTLMGLGVQPDIVICRSQTPVPNSIREKISIFSDVPVDRVYNLYDMRNVYDIPLMLRGMGVDRAVFDVLGIGPKKASREFTFSDWEAFTDRVKNAAQPVTVGIVGKYTDVHDAYLSILKAVEHAAPYHDVKAEIRWIESTDIEDGRVDASDALKGVNGIIVPGGFGVRGVEGKIMAIRYARENNIPFLGLCYGLQLAVVEFAKNVCGLKGANTTENDPDTQYPVIDFLPWQKKLIRENKYGATMRLGGQTVKIKPGTMAYRLYGRDTVVERFRHRYEVNPEYVKILEEHGLIFSGGTPDGEIKQIGELPSHRFFIGTQFHPELTSKPLKPNPLFDGFIQACMKK